MRKLQDDFLRNSKSFDSRNYQLSRCPGGRPPGGFSVPQCPPKKAKNEKILTVMKMRFYIIYSKIYAILYPPGILLAPTLSICGAKHSPSGGRIRKNRVPATKSTLEPCNSNLKIKISTDQKTAKSLFAEQ